MGFRQQRRSHRYRHLPATWLFTDERLGSELMAAVRALPIGAGVVFRHYRTAPPQRIRLLRAIRRIARARALTLVVAGMDERTGEGRHLGPVGRPLSRRVRPHLVTAPAHTVREVAAAIRQGASMLFISPVQATRSHPGNAPLGPAGFARIAARSAVPVVALGGITRRDVAQLRRLGAHGWAGIDAHRPVCKNRVR